MNTLFSKFLIRFILIALIIIIILGFSMIYFFENFYFERKEREIISNSRSVSGFLSQALVRGNQQQLGNWLEILSEINDGVAMLIDEEGVLQMSYPLITEEGNRIDFPRREEISKGNVISSRIEGEYFERPMLLIGTPLAQEEQTYGLLVLTPVAGINQTVNQVQRMMLYSSFIAILLGLIVAYTWSKSLANPLKKMSQVAFRLSNGEFGETVSVQEENEIGTLAESLNYMSKTLKRTVENLTEERNKLRYILTGMEEGVITVNQEGKIILVNSSARKLFDLEKNIENDSLETCFNHDEIIQLLQKSYQQQTEAKQEMFVKPNNNNGTKKRILIHCTPIYIEEEFFGVVALVQDISRRWRFEQLQKDFVANVSHELKAPLSSIRGAGEVLQDDVIKDPEMKDEYLDIILKETDRLEDLVNNILDLSELEGREANYNVKQIEVSHLISRVAKIFRKKITNQPGSLNIYLPEREDIFVKAEEKRLKQVLFNLLDNAFKFSSGQSEVDLGVELEKDMVNFWVKDRGIGIPPEEQDNIWERFYKVDKAHTPDDGGSGLGLAIVKQIIEKYGGEVYVKSEPGQGSIFGFYLPYFKNRK